MKPVDFGFFERNQLFNVTITYTDPVGENTTYISRAFIRNVGDAILIRSKEEGFLIISWENVRSIAAWPLVFDSASLEDRVSMMKDEKLNAIKLVREITGKYLKDAKDFCEKIWDKQF